MSVYNYVSASKELLKELTGSLSKNEIDEMREACAILQKGVVAWIFRNRKEISKFVAAPPSKRQKLKKWKDHPERHLLVFGAIQYLHWGISFLESMERNWIFEGCSYREMASRSGDAFFEVHFSSVLFWPFDDPKPFS